MNYVKLALSSVAGCIRSQRLSSDSWYRFHQGGRGIADHRNDLKGRFRACSGPSDAQTDYGWNATVYRL